MNKIITSFLLLLAFYYGQSQSGNVFSDEALKLKLNEVFNSEKCTDILSNKQKSNYYHTLFFHSFEIQQIDAQKYSQLDYSSITSIKQINKDKTYRELIGSEIVRAIKEGTFNILLSDIERGFDKTKYFKISNTNYIFVLHSYGSLKNK